MTAINLFSTSISCDSFCAVPKPISVTITSDAMSAFRSIGSNITLTCTVELSTTMDIPVTVNTLWTGPDVLMTEHTLQQVGINPSTRIRTSVISSVQKSNCDYYICTAIISSSSLFLSNSSGSGMKIIAIGKSFIYNYISYRC